jgi:hypothetical protein
MFKHIVVGVDGREGGREAVALARLLVAAGGKLTLAYVVARDAHAYRGTSGAPEASDGGRAEALLEAVRGETDVDAHLRWYGSSSVGRGRGGPAEPSAVSSSRVGDVHVQADRPARVADAVRQRRDQRDLGLRVRRRTSDSSSARRPSSTTARR